MYGGGTEYPYLQVVATPGEEAYSQYASEVILTEEEVIEKLKQKHPDIVINFDESNWVNINEYTEGGRIKTVTFGNVKISGVEARTTFGLKSANFKVEKDGDMIKFSVTGYGHGVGMSQTGADVLAKEGKNYEDIINHFYKDIEIKNY